MSITWKKVLAGFMIAGDVFLILVAFALMFEPDMVGISIFMFIFLIVDAYLSIDYIKSLTRQQAALNDQETEEHVAEIRRDAQEESEAQKRDAIDDALAAQLRKTDIKTDTEEDAPDPEELKNMLAKDHLEDADTAGQKE